MTDNIGSAYVGIKPDLSGFAAQLQAGVSQALQGIRGSTAGLQLELPGLQNKAKDLIQAGTQAGLAEGIVIPPSFTRNVKDSFMQGLTTSTEQFLPGFSAATGRVASQMELPLTASFAKAVTQGTQLSLPGFQSSFQGGILGAIKPITGAIDSAVLSPLRSGVGGVLTTLSSGWQSVSSRATAGLGSAVDTFKSGFGSAVSTAGDLINRVLPPSFRNSVTQGFSDFGRSAGVLASGMGSALSAAGSAAANTIGSALGSAYDSAATVFQSGMAAAVVGISALLATGFVAGANLDRMRDAFTALTHSASEAQTIIQQLRQVTILTGLDFNNLAQSAQQLITSGISPDTVLPLLKTVGEMETALGRGVSGLQRASVQFQDIALLNRVTGQQINALARDGVPSFEAATIAAEHLGLAQKGVADEGTQVRDALKAGQITAQSFFDAFQDPRIVSNADLVMQSLQNNIAFQLTKLKAVITHTLAQISEPIDNTLGLALSKITGVFDKIVNNSAVLNSIGQVLAAPFQGLVPLATAAGDALDHFASSLTTSSVSDFTGQLSAFTPLLTLAGAGFASVGAEAARMIPFLGEIVPVINPVLAVFLALTLSTPALRAALAGIAAGFLPFADLVKPLNFLVQGLQVGLEPVLTTVAEKVRPLAQVLSGDLGQAIVSLTPALASLLVAIAPVVGAVLGLATSLLSKLLPALQPVVAGFSSFVETVAPPLGRVLASIVSDLNPVADAFSGLVSALSPLVSGLLQNFGGDLGTVLDKADPTAKAIGKAADAINGGLKDGLTGTKVPLKDFADNLAKIAKILTDQLDPALDRFSKGLTDATPAIRQMATALGQLLSGAAPLLGPLSQLTGWFLQMQVSVLPPIAALNGLGGALTLLGIIVPVVGASFKQLGDDIATHLGRLDRAVAPVVKFCKDVQDNFTRLEFTLIGGSIVPDTVNGIISEFGRLLGSPVDSVASFVGTVLGVMSSLPGEAAGIIGSLVGTVVGFLGGLPPRAAGVLGGFAGAVGAALGGAVGVAGQVAGQVVGAATDGLRGLYGIGLSAAEGIGQGISDAAGAAIAAATSLANGVMAAFAKIVKPGSPSQATYEQFGIPMAQGITQGLSDGLKGMPDLQRLLFGGASLGLDANALQAQRAAPGGGSGAPTINVYVSQPSASVDDITGALTWALSQRGLV